MICPYCSAQSVVIETCGQYPDETGDAVGSKTVTVSVYTPAACPREGCGAWHDGHCDYRGACD